MYEMDSGPSVLAGLVFLANGTSSSPLSVPIIDMAAKDFKSTPTEQSLWGLLYTQDTGAIQGASVTLASSTYISYSYDSITQQWFLSNKQSNQSYCQVPLPLYFVLE